MSTLTSEIALERDPTITKKGFALSLWRSRSRFERTIFILFILTLPFIRARVKWDGIGYYAYLRSPLIDHNLQFAGDWKRPPEKMYYACNACSSDAKLYWNNPANELLFVRLDDHMYVNPITKTGHLPNFYTVGPAILWFPFVAPTHLAVLAADHLGFRIPSHGHSWPYIAALSLGTAFYGLLGLWLSFDLAKNYMEERWAFWATIGIWFASSLPVYMYLNPSWSHTHSAFCVALFLWYWHKTQKNRTVKQWALLGAIAGLMLDVYMANGVFFLAPAIDGIARLVEAWRSRDLRIASKAVQHELIFAITALIAFSPMLIAREIVYGNPFAQGFYMNVPWNWKSPLLGKVLFSTQHGLFVWTPILLLAVLGLFALYRRDRRMAGCCMLMSLAFYYLISSDPWWYGTLSFGNRFFVSLTPIFVLGLGSLFSAAARLWPDSRTAARRLVPVTVLFILWNIGVIYQWSTHMVPTPGVVQWTDVLYDQFRTVPGRILHDVAAKFEPHSQAKEQDQVGKSGVPRDAQLPPGAEL